MNRIDQSVLLLYDFYVIDQNIISSKGYDLMYICEWSGICFEEIKPRRKVSLQFIGSYTIIMQFFPLPYWNNILTKIQCNLQQYYTTRSTSNWHPTRTCLPFTIIELTFNHGRIEHFQLQIRCLKQHQTDSYQPKINF